MRLTNLLLVVCMVSSVSACNRLKPDDPEAHNNLGTALAQKGNLNGAIAEFRQAVRLKPDDPEAHNNLGTALAQKGNMDGAIAEFRQALRLKSDYPEAHNHLGTALAYKGDLDGAIAEYREALRLKPDFTIAHNNLGITLVRKGDLDGAIAEYREALRLKPDLAEAHEGFCIALRHKGDLNGAIAECREALRLKGLRRSAQQSRHRARAKGRAWTEPSPSTAKPCVSSRTSPKRNTISPSRSTSRAAWTRTIGKVTPSLRLGPNSTLCETRRKWVKRILRNLRLGQRSD